MRKSRTEKYGGVGPEGESGDNLIGAHSGRRVARFWARHF